MQHHFVQKLLQDKLKDMSSKPCWNEAWTPGPAWRGHGSHQLWRKGGKVWRKSCQAHAVVLAETVTASKALQKPCHSGDRQMKLPTCFPKSRSITQQCSRKEPQKKYVWTCIHRHNCLPLPLPLPSLPPPPLLLLLSTLRVHRAAVSLFGTGLYGSSLDSCL